MSAPPPPLPDYLTRHAATLADKVAVIDDRPDGTLVRWTFSELNAQANRLANALRAAAADKALACDLLVCPPATLVTVAAQALHGSPVAVGGQDCHAKASGAHTGDISAAMLRAAAVRNPWVPALPASLRKLLKVVAAQ